MIEVHLPDGRVLQFPDGTPEEIVKAAARRMMGPGGSEVPTSGPAATEHGTGMLTRDEKRAQMRTALEHGDLGHAEVEDPGLFGVLKAGLKENVLDPAIGLASRINPVFMAGRAMDKLTGGDVMRETDETIAALRESIHDEHRGTMENYLAQDPNSLGRQAAALGTDFATSVAPVVPGLSGGAARVGAGAARFGARVAPGTFVPGSAASQLLARGVGGAFEGGVVGLGKADPEAPIGEQLGTIGTMAGLGGGMGLLGGARSLARQQDAGTMLPTGLPKPETPPPPTPSVREQIIGTYQAERAMAEQQAAMSIPILVEQADVFLKAREQFPQLPASARPAGIPDTILDELARVKAQERANPTIPTGYSAMNDAKLLQAVTAEAQKKVDAKWQPQFAFAGLSGDEALAALADKAQEAVAPPYKAPPVIGKPSERGAIEFGRGLQRLDVNQDRPLVYEAQVVDPAGDISPGFGSQLDSWRFGAWLKKNGIQPDDAMRRGELQRLGQTYFEMHNPKSEPFNPEAGFLQIGGGKAPAAPADPMDALVRPADDSPNGTAMERLRALGDRLYLEFINKEEAPLNRLRRAGQKDAASYLEQLQSRARGAGGMAELPVLEGTYVFDRQLNGSRRTGDGLAAILGGADGQTLKDLDYFMAGQRHLELEARAAAGEKLKIDPDATTIVQGKLAELQQRYGPDQADPGRVAVLDNLADQVREWSVRAVIDPLVEVGRLTPDEKAMILGKGEKYAPLFRLIERLGEDPEIAVGATKASPIRKITGGLSKDAPAQPPLESFIQQAQRVTMWAERQRVRNFFAEAVDASPELQKEFPNVTSTNPKGQSDRPKSGTFTAWRNGQRSEYAAPADVILAFERLEPRQAPAVLEIAQVAARVLRAGATGVPGFAIKNPIRDQQAGGVYGAEFAYRPFVDAVHGFLEMLPSRSKKAGSVYRQWQAQGGALATLVDNNRPQLERTLADASGSGGVAGKIGRRWMAEGWAGRIFFPVLAPLEFFSGATEKATRVGAFRRATEKGATPLRAAQFSRDVTLDFGRSGRFGQQWNSVEAFVNAELQDANRFVRALRARPAATTIKALTFLTIPAAANYYRWKDDETYATLPEWEKTSFYHVAKRDDGTFVRIPRPLGMLNLTYSYGVQKFLEILDGEHPEAARDLADALFSQTPAHFLNPLEAVPTIGQPAVEAAVNYSAFKQGPIVPAGLQDVLPEDQALDSTTGVAQAIGGATGISPLKVDYLIRGYGATRGAFAASALSGGPPATGLPTTAKDVPGIGAFISPSALGFGSDPVTRLYKLSTEAAQADQSLKLAIEGGDTSRYQKILREHPEALLSSTLTDARQQLSDLRDMRNQIRRQHGMGPQAKKDALLQIDQAATQLAAAYMHGAADYLRGQRP